MYERFGQHGAQFGRCQPYSNFFCVPGGCGPGAWEVKGRWSNLTLTEYGAGQYNDFTFGFNWYWSPNIRVMFDWIHPVHQHRHRVRRNAVRHHRHAVRLQHVTEIQNL